MDLWQAVKQGLIVKVFFPSSTPGGPISGEYLRVKVLTVDPITSENSTFSGEVLDTPTTKLPVKAGEHVMLAVSRVEEIFP